MSRPRTTFARFPAARRRAAGGPYVLALAAWAVVLSATAADAQRPPPGSHLPVANERPAFLTNVGIDPKLGAVVPPELAFRDEDGRAVRLGDYFGSGRPVVLALVYYKCPMLCTVVLNELERTLKGMSLTVGESFDVLAVSFDPRETPTLAAAKRTGYLREYGRPGAGVGWHFLTGDAEPIRRLTETVGFRYAWDAPRQQFVHSSGLIVLTPSGRVSKYFPGIDYPAGDLAVALRAASADRVGPTPDRAAASLYCFQYNPATGKYGRAIAAALRAGGALTALSLGAYIVRSLRRERLKEPRRLD